jgi:hypothetical protein
MEGFFAGYEAFVALTLVVVIFIGFMTERYPVEVTAVAGAAVFLVLGFVPAADAMSVFSNSAPITIAAMFVLTGALVRTGVIEGLASTVLNRSDSRPVLAMATLLVATIAASAFMNNTPIVLILIPIVVRLAQSLEHVGDTPFDPDFLCRHPRRHLHADRHLDQPAGRWRRATRGAGSVHHLRDHAGRPGRGRHRHHGHAALRALPVARPTPGGGARPRAWKRSSCQNCWCGRKVPSPSRRSARSLRSTGRVCASWRSAPAAN